MTARVAERDGQTWVWFQNLMPDSQQILQGEGSARADHSGLLWFEFTDGWGNKGVGVLGPDGVMSLSMTKRSEEHTSELQSPC